MGPEKAGVSGKAGRKIVTTTTEVKKEMIRKHEIGVDVSDLA